MAQFKKVFAAIDSSTKSNDVLKRSIWLAKEEGADLIVMHVVEIPWFEMPIDVWGKKPPIDEEALRKKIEAKISKLNEEAKVKFFIQIKRGVPSEEVIFEAKREQADIIVIGNRGETKISEFILGSTAEKITQKSHIPVLIVKTECQKPYKNILIPTDLSKTSEKSISLTKTLFASSNIEILYAHEVFGDFMLDFYSLSEDESKIYKDKVRVFAKEQFNKFLKSQNFKNGTLIEGSPTMKSALIEYINNKACDLVVLGSEGLRDMGSIILGSTSSFIMREAKCDILVYVIET
jgi:nucleotide-binding universal stress UspA family protein